MIFFWYILYVFTPQSACTSPQNYLSRSTSTAIRSSLWFAYGAKPTSMASRYVKARRSSSLPPRMYSIFSAMSRSWQLTSNNELARFCIFILQSPLRTSHSGLILLKLDFAERITKKLPIILRCEQNGVNKTVISEQNLVIYLIISTHFNEFQDPFSPQKETYIEHTLCRFFYSDCTIGSSILQ